MIYARYNHFDNSKTGRFAVAAAALNMESVEAVHEAMTPELVEERMQSIHERA